LQLGDNDSPRTAEAIGGFGTGAEPSDRLGGAG